MVQGLVNAAMHKRARLLFKLSIGGRKSNEGKTPAEPGFVQFTTPSV
jgi:hypothetical protein